MRRDPYVILGLGIAPSAKQITRAYRKACKKHHPDAGGDPDKFLDVQWAYEVMTDPAKRAAWERGDDPDAKPKPHVDLVAQTVAQLAQGVDLNTTNLIDAARQALGRKKDSISSQIESLSHESGRFREAASRVTSLSDDNVVAGMLEGMASGLDGQAKAKRVEVERVEAALAFLDDYSYRTDGAGPTDAYGLFKQIVYTTTKGTI